MPIDQGPTAQAVHYIRNLMAGDPAFFPDTSGSTSIVGIDTALITHPRKTTLLVHLSDHTTIRLDIERYDRKG
jgi:hypothetical protein